MQTKEQCIGRHSGIRCMTARGAVFLLSIGGALNLSIAFDFCDSLKPRLAGLVFSIALERAPNRG